MREDQLEAMEKMFPKGFILLAVGEDESLRMTACNPSMNEQLMDYVVVLLEIAKQTSEDHPDDDERLNEYRS